MLTYFGAVVKLLVQDRFEAGSLGTMPLWQCRSFCAALAGQQPHKPAMTVSRSGADHNRSAVSVQKPDGGPDCGAHWE